MLIGDGDAPHDASLDALLRDAKPEGLPPEPEESAHAALLYTGGTTGLPKGVLHTQKSIVSSIYRYLADTGLRPGANYLSTMPLFHIGSMATWAYLVPIGGRVVMMPGFEPGRAIRAIRDHRITLASGVPTMFAMMLLIPVLMAGVASDTGRARSQRCRLCRQQGHNAATCPNRNPNVARRNNMTTPMKSPAISPVTTGGN